MKFYLHKASKSVIIQSKVKTKEKWQMQLLMHVCCAPCLMGCIDELIENYDVTCYYYNPNIFPKSEFEKRLEELQKVLANFYPNVKLIVENYEHEEFVEAITGLEDEKEGGVRCENCIDLRLGKTAKLAKENGFDFFDSTLSVSPHKNFDFIKSIGENLEAKFEVKYLGKDFKKKDGFLKSTKLTKQYGIYRQSYCGCEFSQI